MFDESEKYVLHEHKANLGESLFFLSRGLPVYVSVLKDQFDDFRYGSWIHLSDERSRAMIDSLKNSQTKVLYRIKVTFKVDKSNLPDRIRIGL